MLNSQVASYELRANQEVKSLNLAATLSLIKDVETQSEWSFNPVWITTPLMSEDKLSGGTSTKDDNTNAGTPGAPGSGAPGVRRF